MGQARTCSQGGGGGWGRNVVPVAVSGWGREQDRRRAFAAGFDHHLTEPISGHTLEALLRTVSSTLMDSKPGGN